MQCQRRAEPLSWAEPNNERPGMRPTAAGYLLRHPSPYVTQVAELQTEFLIWTRPSAPTPRCAWGLAPLEHAGRLPAYPDGPTHCPGLRRRAGHPSALAFARANSETPWLFAGARARDYPMRPYRRRGHIGGFGLLAVLPSALIAAESISDQEERFHVKRWAAIS